MLYLVSICVLVGFLFGFDVASRWCPVGCSLGCVCVRFGFYLGSIRVLFGSDVGLIRVLFGFDWEFMWVLCGFDLGF